MGIRCESCGKVTENEDTIYCNNCGFRFEKTEQDVLKNIRSLLKKESAENRKNAKLQIRIAYASVLFSMFAFMIALGAIYISVLTLPADKIIVGFVMFGVILLLLYRIGKQYGVPIEVAEIEK